MSTRISRTECIAIYNIETSFFDELAQAGLIVVFTEANELYIEHQELFNLERYVNWHYDLDINIAGLEVITHLLDQINVLQSENRQLKQQDQWTTVVGKADN